MKKVAILLLAAFCFITCNKKNDSCMSVSPESEAAAMAAFCAAQNITYVVDPNGIYYQVVEQGSGVIPDMNSTITVKYSTSTLEGNVVEDYTATPVSKTLSEFIEGWRIALPYIQKGGHLKMVVPSALAYGCTGISNLIVPNSPLYYDVFLIDVQ